MVLGNGKILGIMFGGMFLVLGTASAGFYTYFKYSQKKIEELSGTIAAQIEEFKNAQQEAIIQQLQEDHQLLVESIKKIDEQQEVSKQQVEDLEGKFHKRTYYGERDIGKDAEAKSALVEKVINRGTKKVFLCLEKITGKDDETVENINCN